MSDEQERGRGDEKRCEVRDTHDHPSPSCHSIIAKVGREYIDWRGFRPGLGI